MNYSKQREAILKVLCSTKSHPTAEWIYAKVAEMIPNISLGTVYRNLAMLVENGDAIKIQSAFDKDRFDKNTTRHTHLVCNSCGAVLDIDTTMCLDEKIMAEAPSAKCDFSLVYYGVCPHCKTK